MHDVPINQGMSNKIQQSKQPEKSTLTDNKRTKFLKTSGHGLGLHEAIDIFFHF